MDSIRTEILEAIVKANAVVTELTAEEFSALKKEVKEKYINHGVYSKIRGFPRMWKAFSTPLVSVKNPHAWTWVGDFINGKAEILLLIDDPTERTAFRFDSGRDVLPILEDCFGFEFYVTEKTTGFLLCSQRNDYLFALGDAVEWLQQYLRLNNLTPNSS